MRNTGLSGGTETHINPKSDQCVVTGSPIVPYKSCCRALRISNGMDRHLINSLAKDKCRLSYNCESKDPARRVIMGFFIHFNFWTCVLLIAVLLVGVSCVADPKPDQDDSKLGFEWQRANGLERRKRAPKFELIMDFGTTQPTPGAKSKTPILDFLRGSFDRNYTHSSLGGLLNLPLFRLGGSINGPRLFPPPQSEGQEGEEITTSPAPSHTQRPTVTTVTEISTTETIVGGCIIPEQPIGVTFGLTMCVGPSCTATPGNTVPIGSLLIYNCNEGYTLQGHYASFCSYGRWHNTPTCIKTCPVLKSKSLDVICKHRGEIVSCKSDIMPGTTATLTCKNSYKLPLSEDLGYRKVTCLEGGTWDHPLFRCVPECGTSVARGAPFIVNGIPAERSVFPWHVGIYKQETNGDYNQVCGGSLISPGLVVSAGHCFYDETIESLNDYSHYAVAAGKHNRLYNWPERDVQKSTIRSLVVPSRFVGLAGNYANDIALLRLQNPFNLTTSIRPVCMDWDNTHEREHLQQGIVGKAVGWGKDVSGTSTLELHELSLPYIPFLQCHSSVPQDFRGFLTDDKFCAGWLNGSSLCDGDSGGGLAFQIGELWYLRGVVSVGPVDRGMCDYRYYTAFTNVGRFRDWIRDALSQEE